MHDAVVAIVGRPNVGKSTLFNRLLGHRKALTDPSPATTRDRLTGTFRQGRDCWTVVDTGGVVQGDKSQLASHIQGQVQKAIQKAHLILFVVDLTQGLVPQDERVADLLRKSHRPILLVANKADKLDSASAAFEFYRLGFGDPCVVSASRNLGVAQLKRAIAQRVKGAPCVEEPEAIRIAIVGRPNVGKSSFLNYLLQEERVIVDDKEGTTRDAVDVSFRKGDRQFVLIDTAGIRREVRLKDSVILKGVRLSKETVQRSDLCLVMMDATAQLQGEELRILEFIVESKRGAVLLVNKWDLLEERSPQLYEEALRRRAPFLRFIPVLMISCVTGKNVLKALDVASEVHSHFQGRFETHRLNKVLEKLRETTRLPGEARFPFRYITQIGNCPPHFLIFGADPKELLDSWIQCVERGLRHHLPLEGTPIQLSFRKKETKR